MKASRNESPWPLLSAILTAAGIFVGSALAVHSPPPPQPPFPYPPLTLTTGTTVPLTPPCGKDGQLALYPPFPGRLAAKLLPIAKIVNAPMQGADVPAKRLFLAKRATTVKRWLYLLDVDGRRQVADVNFKRCSLLSFVVPGNTFVTTLGVRKNNAKTLTVGVDKQKRPTTICGGTTTGTTSPPPPPPGCQDVAPIPGTEIVLGLPRRAVASVQRLYVLTQPPPPPTGGTTG